MKIYIQLSNLLFLCSVIMIDHKQKIIESLRFHIKQMNALTNLQNSSKIYTETEDITNSVFKSCFPNKMYEELFLKLSSFSKILNFENEEFSLFFESDIRYTMSLDDLEDLILHSNNYIYGLLFTAFIFRIKSIENYNIFDLSLKRIILENLSTIEQSIDTIEHITTSVKSITDSVAYCLKLQKRITTNNILNARFFITKRLKTLQVKLGKITHVKQHLLPVVENTLKDIEENINNEHLFLVSTDTLKEQIDKFKDIKNVDFELKTKIKIEYKHDNYVPDKVGLICLLFNEKRNSIYKGMNEIAIKNIISDKIAKNVKEIKELNEENKFRMKHQLRETRFRLWLMVKYIKREFAQRTNNEWRNISIKSKTLAVLCNILNGFNRIVVMLDGLFVGVL